MSKIPIGRSCTTSRVTGMAQPASTRTRHTWILLMTLVLIPGCQLEKVADQTKNSLKFEASWESLQQFETPEWFKDAKFGIYCHWGPYSVPAYKTEWYSHWMYVKDHEIRKYHEEKYGPLSIFGYKDFIPMFTAEKFNADEWADLFKKAGAKFGGPVTEHADGFAMWDSKLTEWDAKDMGPKRDIVGEMAVALRKKGLKFIATYHRHWLYAWYPTWDEHTDASNPAYAGLYGLKVPEGTFVMANQTTVPLPDKKFNQEWYDRIIEVVDQYEPDLIWFDNKMDIIAEEYRLNFLSYYYNAAKRQNREVVATYKFTDFQPGSAVLDVERARMSDAKPFAWLTDDSIDWGSWCDVRNPDYKTINRLIDVFIDIVSKNGCLLLNITPRANGEIPAEVKNRLLKIGAWLKVNGEAIYGTRPWKIYGQGPTKVVEGHLSERLNPDNTAEDIRFTTKGEYLYAIILDWPGEQALIPALKVNSELYGQEINSIQLLGSEAPLQWQRTEEGLIIKLPAEKPCDHAYAFKIQ